MCSSAGRFLHGPGNAEITKLIISEGIDKNILRFYIPVDDPIIMAINQRITNVRRKLFHLRLAQQIALQMLQKGSQEFHADQHIPPHLILMGDHFVILVGYDIRVPFQFRHGTDLRDDLLHKCLEIRRNGSLIHPFRQHRLQFAF